MPQLLARTAVMPLMVATLARVVTVAPVAPVVRPWARARPVLMAWAARAGPVVLVAPGGLAERVPMVMRELPRVALVARVVTVALRASAALVAPVAGQRPQVSMAWTARAVQAVPVALAALASLV
jgi:hypothetical protein